jgi:hypothetical protein
MALAVAQFPLFSGKNTTAGATTLVVSPAANATAGSLIIAYVNASAARTVTGVSDTKGNTWTVGPNPGGASVNGQRCSTQQNAGTLTTGDSITFTFSGTGANKVGTSIEITGYDTTTPFDSGVTNTVVGTTSTSPSVTAAGASTVAHEAIIGLFAWAGAAQRTFTKGASYTASTEFDEGSGAFQGIAIEYKIVSATGTYTADGTLNLAPTSFTVEIIGVREASSGITLSAPVATVASAGFLGSPSERASAILATVAAAGGTPLAKLIASAPVATVSAVGFPGSFPAGTEQFRTRWFRTVVETLSTKSEGWWRF